MNMLKEDILALTADDVRLRLDAGELIDIATLLHAFWRYDYDAAKDGRLGLHALLKSGLHSDGFFVSRILLEPERMRRAIALMMVDRLKKAGVARPDYVVGIPNGATKLGTLVAEIFGSQEAKMKKDGKRIVMDSVVPSGATVLLIEDFCTRGTGFIEAAKEVKNQQPSVELVPYDPVIINRGGLESVDVDGVGPFTVLALVNNRIQDWEGEKCPLCEKGSGVIKPKVNDHNWKLITTAQLP